jgi:hypothetical protein
MSHITAVDVRVANVEVEELNLENHVGNQQDTRKNPHVIDAGLKQDLPVNYWCIMLMGTLTTLL